MSVAKTMLKEIVTLAKKLATQEHENKRLWSSNMQLQVVRDSKAKQLRESEQELQRLRKRHVEVQSEEVAAAKAEIEALKSQRDAARAKTVEVRRLLNEETDRHNRTNAEKVELFQQKEVANKCNAELVKERDAAHMTILAQKRGIQYLRLLIDKVRGIVGRDDAMSERLEQISQALEEFDHGTIEPTPSPEVERLRAFVGKVRAARDEHNGLDRDARLEAALAELDAGTEPTPVAEPIDSGPPGVGLDSHPAGRAGDRP